MIKGLTKQIIRNVQRDRAKKMPAAKICKRYHLSFRQYGAALNGGEPKAKKRKYTRRAPTPVPHAPPTNGYPSTFNNRENALREAQRQLEKGARIALAYCLPKDRKPHMRVKHVEAVVGERVRTANSRYWRNRVKP